MLSECDRPPNSRLAITATVINADGTRARLSIVCASRSDAEAVVDTTYPNAVFTSMIVRRQAQGGGQ